VAGMVVLDRAVLRFFAARKGWWFAARAMAWQLLYHLYSGASLAVAVVHQLTGCPFYLYRRWQWRRLKAARRAAAATAAGRLGAQVPRHLVAATRHRPAGAVPVPVVEMEPAAPVRDTAGRDDVVDRLRLGAGNA
jgi:hypothetical protein